MLTNIQLDKKKLLISHIIILFFGGVITSMVWGVDYSASYFMGGIVVFVANLLVFTRMFINKQFSPSIEIMIFYMSEMLKLTIVAVITIVLAIYVKPKLFPYIFGLISLQLVMCFVPMLLKKVR